VCFTYIIEQARGERCRPTTSRWLNTKGEYFPHLSPALGAKPYEFPAEFVRLALEACPGLDSESTRGGVTVVNTVRTIR
jgi:hypothetical protein